MEATGQNHNGVMQLLKGWLDKNGCEEMTTENDIMSGIVMTYKVGNSGFGNSGMLLPGQKLRNQGAFPIIITRSNHYFQNNLESVFCQLSDFFCDEHGWEVKSSSLMANVGSSIGGRVMFYMKK